MGTLGRRQQKPFCSEASTADLHEHQQNGLDQTTQWRSSQCISWIFAGATRVHYVCTNSDPGGLTHTFPSPPDGTEFQRASFAGTGTWPLGRLAFCTHSQPQCTLPPGQGCFSEYCRVSEQPGPRPSGLTRAPHLRVRTRCIPATCRPEATAPVSILHGLRNDLFSCQRTHLRPEANKGVIFLVCLIGTKKKLSKQIRIIFIMNAIFLD